jgi:hypothetical protein
MALPPTILTIVGLIGHGPAMQLVRELGGQDFRFPVTKRGANWEHLVEIVGDKAAGKLLEYFKGEEVYIAWCDKALRQDRNRRMILRYEALLAEGHSSRGAVSILVRECGPISNRRVEIIVNGPIPAAMPAMAAQGSLF